jgi:hypothetical protein
MSDQIRTFDAARRWLTTLGVVPLTGSAPSLVHAVVGTTIRGSWWGHEDGGLIYDLATALEQDPDVQVLRLVERNQTFVHRALWPALYGVLLSPEWVTSVTRDLDDIAAELLAEAMKADGLRLDSWEGASGKRRIMAKDSLLERLLVDGKSEHTGGGTHQTVLRAWSAPPGVEPLPFKDAVATLQAACGGRSDALKQWG